MVLKWCLWVRCHTSRRWESESRDSAWLDCFALRLAGCDVFLLLLFEMCKESWKSLQLGLRKRAG